MQQRRPPLAPHLTSNTTRIRSNEPMEFNASHDLDFVDSTNINYHDDNDDEIFEAEYALEEYNVIETNLSNTASYMLDSIKYDNDYSKDKDISLNIDNYSETNSNLDDKIFKDLSDNSQDRIDVNSINVNKSFESDNLSYSQTLISSTNTTINENLDATDKVDITNESSHWDINNVNDSFVLVQDFYDSRFSE